MNEFARTSAAERIDNWYSGRFERNYLPENNEYNKNLFIDTARKIGIRKLSIEIMIKNQFDLTAMRIKSKRLFVSHLNLSMDLHSNRSTISWAKALSEEDRKKYVQPTFDCLSRYNAFFDKVSEKQTRGKFLPYDPLIDKLFLENFKGVDGFVEFEKKYIDAKISLMDAKQNMGKISKEEYEDYILLGQAVKPSIEYAVRRVFCDLSGRKHE